MEAEDVRLIFRLFLEGHEQSGPMGVKAIVTWLNSRGHRTRGGSRWGVGSLHQLLTNPVYAGRMQFNRKESRPHRRKHASETISADVPRIVEPELFEGVQGALKARNPKVTPPRVVTGPILLTGLATCAACHASMTVRTGTSKSGRVHRYYACSTSARMGKGACAGRSIPMGKLDALVTSQLIDRLLAPERLREMLTRLMERRVAKSVEVDLRIRSLQAKAEEADERLRRLYTLVETGDVEPDNLLTSRIAALNLDRQITREALERAQGSRQSQIVIDDPRVDAFGQMMRERLTTGDIPFRKAYLGAIIDRVQVGQDRIEIFGRKDVLEQAVAAGASLGVRSFVRRWRAGKDSNPRPPNS